MEHRFSGRRCLYWLLLGLLPMLVGCASWTTQEPTAVPVAVVTTAPSLPPAPLPTAVPSATTTPFPDPAVFPTSTEEAATSSVATSNPTISGTTTVPPSDLTQTAPVTAT